MAKIKNTPASRAIALDAGYFLFAFISLRAQAAVGLASVQKPKQYRKLNGNIVLPKKHTLNQAG